MNNLARRLASVAEQRVAGSNEGERIISLANLATVAAEFGLTRHEAELAALQQRVVPERYQRNLGTIGLEGQLRLRQATVGVVGAGGLGGWVIDGLARMGVGQLIIADGDAFVESNLNRQAFCNERTLGRLKAEVACEAVAEINSAVQTREVPRYLQDSKSMCEALAGSQVLVDALDSLPARLQLQLAAQELHVPLIHGAIAGFVGQVLTIFPGDPGLIALYGDRTVPEHGVETQWGNPASTPMLVAALQVQEVVKVLTGRGQPLQRRMFLIDGETGTVDILEV